MSKEKHDCNEHKVFLDPCNCCVEQDRECPLSTKGICSICGEVVQDV